MTMKRTLKSDKSGGENIRLPKNGIIIGAILLINTALLAAGLVLANIPHEIIYTLDKDKVQRENPLAFFGIIAAVVLGISCVLTAFLLAGSLSRGKKAPAVITAVFLIAVSLVMIGSAAVVVFGFPVSERRCYRYTDENFKLIIEETSSYFTEGSVNFFLAEGEDNRLRLLAGTTLRDYPGNAERYKLAWVSDTQLMAGFEDGGKYRTIQMNV